MDDPTKKNLEGDLIWAIRRNDVKKTEQLLSEGVDANCRDASTWNGWTALMWAAEKGNLEAVSKLIESGASVDMTDEDGWTALMWAARDGNLEVVNSLIASGANVDMTEMIGWTALMFAARSGRQEVVTKLIDSGACVDTTNKVGRTALMYAAWEGHKETMRKLLESGAYMDATDKNGETALDLAKTDEIKEIIKAHIAAGGSNTIEMDERAKKQLEEDLIEAIKSNDPKKTEQLLSEGVDANCRDASSPDGRNALMWAAWNDRLAIASKLIESGASVDMIDKDGWTALMYAAGSGHLEVMSSLIQSGASLDMTNKLGTTALMWAAKGGYLETVRKLMESGACVDTTDEDGKTALDLAENDEIREIIKAHIAAGDQDAQALPVPVPVGYRHIPGTSLCHLYLPEEVSEDPQVESLKDFDSTVKANELLLTPVVSVSPKGLEFSLAKPAIIVLPKVVEPDGNHQLIPLCSSATESSQLRYWTERTESTQCEMLEDHIMLKTTTLGLFAVVARFPYPSSSISIKPDTNQELSVPELKGFKVELPPNSLPRESAEAVEEIKATVYYSDCQPQSEHNSLASARVDIEPHGVQFAQSIPVTLPIPDYAKITEEDPDAELEIWQAAAEESNDSSQQTFKRLDSSIEIHPSEDGFVATSQISESGVIENRWNKRIQGLGAGTAYSTSQQKPKFIFGQIRAFMTCENIYKGLNRFGILAVVDSIGDPKPIPEEYEHNRVASTPLRLTLGELSIGVEIYNNEEELSDAKSVIAQKFWPQFNFSVKLSADTPLIAGSIFGQLHIQQKDQYPQDVNLTKKLVRKKQSKEDFEDDSLGPLLSATTTDVYSRWNLEKVHSAGITGKGTVIAIIDCGINLDHDSVKEKKAQIQGTKSAKATPTDDPDKPEYHSKDAEHGTAVAAIAAGNGVHDDAKKLKIRCGVAKDAELYVYRLSEGVEIDEVHEALKHISSVEPKVDIICMSFGFEGHDDEIETLLSELAGKGVVCLAAAGNDGNFQEAVKFPASSGHVLSVGALTIRGQSSDLNPQDNIDVFAIGEKVIVPTSRSQKVQQTAEGTSYAAPMVAGLISLLMQYAKEVDQDGDKIYKRLHTVSFLRRFFKDHKLCNNRKLVYVDSYFDDLLDFLPDKKPKSPLVKCINLYDGK